MCNPVFGLAGHQAFGSGEPWEVRLAFTAYRLSDSGQPQPPPYLIANFISWVAEECLPSLGSEADKLVFHSFLFIFFYFFFHFACDGMFGHWEQSLVLRWGGWDVYHPWQSAVSSLSHEFTARPLAGIISPTKIEFDHILRPPPAVRR
jgi:hypothetical protein